jgi:signal transduction histidine kinase
MGERVPYVRADEGKIRQALINLLGNAIKFTKRGYIRAAHQSGEEGAAISSGYPSGLKTRARAWQSSRTGAKLFEPFRQSQARLEYTGGNRLGAWRLAANTRG